MQAHHKATGEVDLRRLRMPSACQRVENTFGETYELQGCGHPHFPIAARPICSDRCARHRARDRLGAKHRCIRAHLRVQAVATGDHDVRVERLRDFAMVEDLTALDEPPAMGMRVWTGLADIPPGVEARHLAPLRANRRNDPDDV